MVFLVAVNASFTLLSGYSATVAPEGRADGTSSALAEDTIVRLYLFQ
jgi:hypothetical protein